MSELVLAQLPLITCQIGEEEDDGLTGRKLDILFARKGVSAAADSAMPFRAYFSPDRFAKFQGEQLELFRSHDVSTPTLGIGTLDVISDREAWWRGRLHNTTQGRDLAIEIQTMMAAGKPLEASVGFFFRKDAIRQGKQLTSYERSRVKADIVIDEIEALRDMSIARRGRVEGTKVLLNDESTQQEFITIDSLVLGSGEEESQEPEGDPIDPDVWAARKAELVASLNWAQE